MAIHRGTNTQTLLPDNLYLGDIDGDGVSEYLQFSSNKIFVCRSDYEKTGMLHTYLKLPIKRILIGSFSDLKHQLVVAIMTNNELALFGINPERDKLWWAFSQDSFISDDEDAIVSDFNGDGKDDILIYNRNSGQIRMYSPKNGPFFHPMPKFDIGNLSRAAIPGMRFRAGDFTHCHRQDLATINSSGQISVFASVWDDHNYTFWWCFTSNCNVIPPGVEVIVARIDDSEVDGLALHNSSTGHTRFLKLEYNGGSPAEIANVSTGQIDTNANSSLFFARMRGDLHEPGALREDAIVFLHSSKRIVRSDARWDGQELTYWFAHRHAAPKNHYGWGAFESKPWLLIKCKFADVPDVPKDDAFWRNLFSSKFHQSIVYYLLEISYGSLETTGNKVDDNWYTMNLTVNQSKNESRAGKIQHGLDAAHADTRGFHKTVVVVNSCVDSGYHGNVLLDPWAYSGTVLAQAMLYGFGFGCSFNDTSEKREDWAKPGQYGDKWDIMSARNVFTFQNERGMEMGPEMNGLLRLKAGWIPSHRLLTLDSSAEPHTISLAALNKPENNGPLLLRIGRNDSNYYTIEFRQKVGYDAGIPRDTVLVHQCLDQRSILITGNGAERLPGSEYRFANGMTLQVKSFTGNGIAEVKVTVP